MEEFIASDHEPPIFLNYKLKKLKKYFGYYLILMIKKKKEKYNTKIIFIMFN